MTAKPLYPQTDEEYQEYVARCKRILRANSDARRGRPWGSNPNLPDCNVVNRRMKAQG